MRIKPYHKIYGIVISIVFSFVTGSDARKDYILKDFRYFKPMIADIRTSTQMMRLYRQEAIEFTIPKDVEIEDHLFWDASYGGVLPLIGYNFAHDPEQRSPLNPMEVTGLMTFVDASAHVLLDFDAESSSVINTDFRIGAGLATRLPGGLKNFSFRYRFFHESTHIGDEYSLFGSQEYGDLFRRYNVSYEAHDFFLSIDRYVPVGEKLMPLRIAYFRLYGGGRIFTDGFDFSAKEGKFPELNDRTAPLRSSDHEIQLGVEIFFRAFRKQVGPILLRRLRFQYLFAAADFYFRDRYAIDAPEQIWSRNVMVGIVFGDYFKDERDLRIFLNYYNGVHPHGQFRKEELDYVGISIASGF